MSLDNLQRISKSKNGWQLDYLIEGRKLFDRKDSFFIAGRHWNSDTPLTPRRTNPKHINNSPSGASGGGYFLYHLGIGVAIDPGIAFLKTLYERHDISLSEIDIIIITHFHQDHCSDLETILNLSARTSKRPVLFAPIPVIQYVKLLSSVESFAVFPGDELSIFEVSETEEKSNVIQTKQKIIHFTFLPALHWQTINLESLQTSEFPEFVDFHMSGIGVSIELLMTDENQEFKNIVITGDTLFPYFEGNNFTESLYDLYLKDDEKTRKIHMGLVTHLNREYLEAILDNYFLNFIAAYQNLSADLICFHLGSIEKGFSTLDITDPILNFHYHGHHLGILGIFRLLGLMDLSSLKMGIITEWGEELSGERKNISKYIGDIISALREEDKSKNSGIPFMPSDIDLRIQLNTGLLECSDHDCSHYYKYMSAVEDMAEYIKYMSNIKNPDIKNYERTCNWQTL